MFLICKQVTLRLKGHGMGSTRCCIFPPTIFYVLSKVNEDGSYIVVYRSETAPGDTPSWLPVTISIRSLCNGDKDRGLQFHFFQEGFNGYHTSLGFVLTSVNRMRGAPEGSTVKLLGKNGKVCRYAFRFSYIYIQYQKCNVSESSFLLHEPLCASHLDRSWLAIIIWWSKVIGMGYNDNFFLTRCRYLTRTWFVKKRKNYRCNMFHYSVF